MRELLRRIDARVVPPLGEALYRLVAGPSRLRLPLLAGLTCGAVLLAAALWKDGRPGPPEPASGPLVRVGVPAGRSVAWYLADSRREVAALAASGGPATGTYALIVFAAYLAPERFTPVVRGLPVYAAYARVPLPETQTEIVRITGAGAGPFRVPEELLAGMEQVALRKSGTALDYRELGAKLTGAGEQERRLRAAYGTTARAADAEAEAYRQRCSCLYAAIVRATPAELVRVAAREEVRAVDPAPEVDRLDRAVFLPPLPEQAGSDGSLADTRPGALPGPLPAGPRAGASSGEPEVGNGGPPV